MENLEKIKEQVREVIRHSQSISNPKVDSLIDTWYENKKYFIELFDDKLIYTTSDKITVDLSDDTKAAQIDDFIHYLEKLDLEDLAMFVFQNSKDFFSNITTTPYTYEKRHMTVPAGIKITKAFKFFIDDPITLDAVQTKASQIIQCGKLNGYLNISVHPLDFLSSSENTYNWRSCHALDGEYRVGNLSYMLDKTTVICYISDNKPEKLPRFPDSVFWNSKKWRMLLFLSDEHNAMFAGRHYPFFSEEVMEEIRSIITKRMGQVYPTWWGGPMWSHWHNDFYKFITFQKHGEDNFYIPNTRCIPIRDNIVKMSDLVTDVDGSLHFNDLLNSTCYVPYYCWNENSRKDIHFTIGSEVSCLECEDHLITELDTMRCDWCGGKNMVTCGCCGDTVREDNAFWVDSENAWICGDCFDREYFQCVECGEIFPIDEAHGEDDLYCTECYKRLEE